MEEKCIKFICEGWLWYCPSSHSWFNPHILPFHCYSMIKIWIIDTETSNYHNIIFSTHFLLLFSVCPRSQGQHGVAIMMGVMRWWCWMVTNVCNFKITTVKFHSERPHIVELLAPLNISKMYWRTIKWKVRFHSSCSNVRYSECECPSVFDCLVCAANFTIIMITYSNFSLHFCWIWIWIFNRRLGDDFLGVCSLKYDQVRMNLFRHYGIGTLVLADGTLYMAKSEKMDFLRFIIFFFEKGYHLLRRNITRALSYPHITISCMFKDYGWKFWRPFPPSPTHWKFSCSYLFIYVRRILLLLPDLSPFSPSSNIPYKDKSNHIHISHRIRKRYEDDEKFLICIQKRNTTLEHRGATTSQHRVRVYKRHKDQVYIMGIHIKLNIYIRSA